MRGGGRRAEHTWPGRGSRRTGFFVDLNSSLVAIKSNDFTNEEIFTNMALEGRMVLVRQYHFRDKAQMSFPGEECWEAYQLVHSTANHVLSDNDRAGD